MDSTELLDMVVTYHDKCSACSSPTIAVDLPELHGRRICIQCLLAEIDLADSDIMANLEYDLDEVTHNLEVCTEGYDTLKKDNSSLQDEVADLQGELEAKQNLVRVVTRECDALRRRIEEFDDDNTAIQNENARLKLDMQSLRERMIKHGQL